MALGIQFSHLSHPENKAIPKSSLPTYQGFKGLSFFSEGIHVGTKQIIESIQFTSLHTSSEVLPSLFQPPFTKQSFLK